METNTQIAERLKYEQSQGEVDKGRVQRLTRTGLD
jgi:hypothetical protein